MNERIKELAEQANEYANSRLEGPSPIWFACFNEKFAELIVKECAGIYDKIDNGNLHIGTDNYLEALAKHFGVDE